MNSVVGFIGPEYLYDGKQITRAALEDHFCGKLLGLPMGVDVCYTNHSEADQDDMDALLTLLGVAGVNFVMGVPGADDVMLNYQSTSFHDAQYLRRILGLRPAPEFEHGWSDMGISDERGWIRDAAALADASQRLLAFDGQAVGSHETAGAARPRTRWRCCAAGRRPAWRWDTRRGACPRPPCWTSSSITRGRAMPFTRALDAARLAADLAPAQVHPGAQPGARPHAPTCSVPIWDEAWLPTAPRACRGVRYDVVFILADGLSARAVQPHAAPTLRAHPARALPDWRIAPLIIATQARVALGDDIGARLKAALSVMLIGERPGLSCTRQPRGLSHLEARAGSTRP